MNLATLIPVTTPLPCSPPASMAATAQPTPGSTPGAGKIGPPASASASDTGIASSHTAASASGSGSGSASGLLSSLLPSSVPPSPPPSSLKRPSGLPPLHLPFPLSVRTEIRLEKLAELTGLHGQALAVAEKFRDLCAEESAACAGEIAHEIGRRYCDPLRKLEAADRQAVDTLGQGFLNAEERELVYYRFSDRETLLELWEDAELLTRDRELLEKYAPALEAETSRITSPWATASADGHVDDREEDYTAVIDAALKVNEGK